MSFGSGTIQDVLHKLDEVGNTVSSAVNTLFKKDLHDLVSGLRANKGNESKFINDCIQEIKEELKSPDSDDRTNAVLKLIYLQMLGYNMDWASFRAIEVIAQSNFGQKRIGYLAASQSFSESTDVILLITNLIRKDCLSPNLYDGGIALNCLSNICTPDLARDLVPDIVSMLTSARPYIRKKAVLVMYKIFLRFPDALRPSFPRLKEKLEDPESAVVCAAVNVICELAKKNAKNYLPLAPILFKILTTSNNNWLLIKIIKLFALLIPLEERLGKRLAEPLCNIINSTNSMSLMYEAIFTCIVGLSGHRNVLQLCISKLRIFIEHPDQNLKYLGLVALSKIMDVFPKGIMEHRDIILHCLEDEDQTIRLRAVDLLTGMVDKTNLAYIVDKLRHYLETAEGSYREELLEKIIYICSQDKYTFVTDFEWYLGVLIDLTHIKGIQNGSIVSAQLLDVSVRVKGVRPSASKMMLDLLKDKVLLTEDVKAGSMCECLYAAAWIVGEYAEHCEEHLSALEVLTQAEVAGLPAHIQSIYIHNALKIFAAMTLLPENSDLENSNILLKDRLPLFTASPYIEVQERATFFEQLIKIFEEQRAVGVNIGNELAIVASDALLPVAPGVQHKVPKPAELDLEAWINDPISEDEEPIFQQPKSWEESISGSDPILSDVPAYPVRKVDQAQIDEQSKAYAREVASNESYIKDPVEEPVQSLATAFPGMVAEFREQISNHPDSGKNSRRSYAPKLPRPAQQFEIFKDEDLPPGYIPEETKGGAGPVIHSPKDALSQDFELNTDINSSVLEKKRHKTYETDQPKRNPVRNPTPSGPQGGPPTSPGGRGAPPPAGGRFPPGPRPGPPGRFPPGQRPPPGGRFPPGTRPPPGGRFPPGQRPPGGRYPPGQRPPGPPGAGGRRPPPGNRPPPSTAAKPNEGAPPNEANKIPNPRISALAKDSNIEISIELISNKKQPNQILGVFFVKNLTDQPIEKAQFSFEDSPNFKLAPHPSRQPIDPVPLSVLPPPNSLVTIKLPFQYESFQEPHKLNGSLEYSSGKIDFSLLFPCSASLVPEEITLNNFLLMVSKEAQETRTIDSINTTLQKATAKLAGYLRLKLVQREEGKVSLYGRTISGTHLGVLIKKNEGREDIAIAIKSDSAALLDNILKEIQTFEW